MESPLKGRKGFWWNVEIAYQVMNRIKIIRVRSPSPFKTFKTFQEYSKKGFIRKGNRLPFAFASIFFV